MWGLQPFILGFAIYHQVELDNTFIFASSLVYMAALLIIPTVIMRDQPRLRSVIQALLITNMLLNGFGAYGWYSTTFHYDDVVHFLSPAILVWGVCVWFRPRQMWKAVFFSILVGLVWEPMEYFGDQLLSTHTYGQPGQPLDTVYDIIMDTLGVIGGIMLFQLTRRPVLAWVHAPR